MHRHPGDAVFYVESGTIGWTTGEGSVVAMRATSGTPVAGEALAAGSEVMLQRGDAVFYDQRVTHDVRDAGSTPAVVLYSGLRASDQPGVEFVGRPTP